MADIIAAVKAVADAAQKFGDMTKTVAKNESSTKSPQTGREGVSSPKGGFKEFKPWSREIPKFKDLGNDAPQTSLSEGKVTESQTSDKNADSVAERQDVAERDGTLKNDAINEPTSMDENFENGSRDLEKTDSARDGLQEDDVNEASLEKKERAEHIPRENGHWDGEPGNSTWHPDPDFTPKKSNPEGKTWREIIDDKGIDYKNGEVDFSPHAEGTVEIKDFSDSRSRNFARADESFAEKWNNESKDGRTDWTSDDVAEYRENKNLTLHERSDMKTMDLVPSEIHNNVPHSGGISKYKQIYIA